MMALKYTALRLIGVATALLLLTFPTGGSLNAAQATATNTPAPAPAKQIVAYFASWDAYGRNYSPAQIPVSKLTMINYAFARPAMDGGCAIGDAQVDTNKYFPGDNNTDPGALHGNFAQLLQMRKANPALGVSISIGGWNWSDQFSRISRTADGRQKFVAACIAMFIKGELPAITGGFKGLFDGIDIDWEYPTCCGAQPVGADAYSPLDTQNYTLLLQEFRRQLDVQGAADGVHYRLTAALPAGATIYPHIDLKAAATSLDWLNLMAYDFNGGWEKTTGFNAPLYAPDSSAASQQNNTDSAVQAYLAAGVPSAKIVLGVPFYTHSWKGVPDVNHGLGQTGSGVPAGTWDDSSSGATGIQDYADIVAHYLPKYQRYWSDSAQVPWLYNAADGIFISYDDPQSIGIKADYVNKNALGGMMIWEISSDNGDLLNTIAAKLRP